MLLFPPTNMFSHVGSAFPSSFSEFSKSITNTIASQLKLSGNKREVPNYKADGDEHPPPTIDPDVLLSYYMHAAEHRPLSRLLKERVFDNRLNGPRSANLLVSGSPIFERPWRCVMERVGAQVSCVALAKKRCVL